MGGLRGKATASWRTPAEWYDRPLRWANLTLVQNDPGRYDPALWLDLLRRSRCDAASWNSGGIVAFYPTELPFHRRNAAMGDTDPLGELVEGCRELGIFVTARVDHHATYPEAAEAHPEWLLRDPEGRPRRHWADPELYLTCAYGPYNEQFMTSVMVEVVSLYGVDGFNHNRWGGQGMCWCEACREEFRAWCGEELPLAADGTDAGWQGFRMTDPRTALGRQYLAWREHRILGLWDHWETAIREVNPNAALLPGMGAEMTRLDMTQLRRRAHSLYIDRQGRHGSTPVWVSGKLAKELRAVIEPRPVGLTFSVGHEHPMRWKDSVTTEAEVRLWALEAVANGAHLKFCKFAGTLYDPRWLPVIERLYTQLAAWEPYLRDRRSLARVGVVYSQQTARYRDGLADLHDRHEPTLGLYQALLEARLPFEMVHDRLLVADEIDRYGLLCLPDIACLDDGQCAQLREYVARGGSLLATGETSLYDRWGERRPDFGLSDLFGVRATGPTAGPLKNAYVNVEPGDHPVLAGFDPAQRMIFGTHQVPVEPRAEFGPPPLTLVPAYPDLPMEEVYPRPARTDRPAVWLRQVGRGRVACVPWSLARTFWQTFDADQGRLLGNLARWALGEPAPVEVDGPGLLDVTAWRLPRAVTVHLLNLTNPQTFRGPVRECYPVGPLTVHLRLEPALKVRRVALLTAAAEPAYQRLGDCLTLVVPQVDDLETVAVDVD